MRQRQDGRQFETNFSDRIYRINKMRISCPSCYQSEERALQGAGVDASGVE
ncbi:MAG: hypothetical protein Q7U60_09600 [Candidatus Methanoperedens sp.]|nr:hypothetical protein [Candidatus Methanoperedens sp.]